MDIAFTLIMLILLQAVLGLDNLLYISLESQRVVKEKQAMVRRLGIGVAIGLRIILLFIVIKLVEKFSEPFFKLQFGNQISPKDANHAMQIAHESVEKSSELVTPAGSQIHGIVDGAFNLHSIIVLIGGAFILYTAMKEIFHMIGKPHLGHDSDRKPQPVGKTITLIVLMNLIFSFDSILSAMALADNNIVLITISIVVGGILMIWLSDHVSSFLAKNRMYEVLGLFILFIVGIMLLTEGAHLAHLHIAGNAIHPMTKTTFYFVIGVLVITEIVQTRYKRKILAEQAAAIAKH